jgi:NADPH-dependent 2,4-dienoyl-CoA reductase/sulfur reductase-like enzyme
MKQRPLVIVGAGPAGMSAAIAAAESGLRPLVIDENPQAGGQIFRQPPAAAQHPLPGGPRSRAERGSALLRRFHGRGDRMELRTGTVAWGLFPPRRLAVSHADGWELIEARHLVLAPGAYEYVPPFPGWTLPGVMTPGGAQALVKTMQVLPGKRVLVAGTGPFLLVVADQLHRAGMEVLGVVEMARAGEALRCLPGLLAAPGLLWEGLVYLYRLKRAGIPVYRGHLLVEVRGDTEVREAVFAPCDAQGHPDGGRPRTVRVDTVCAGYGFIPRIQLAQLAGCRLRFEDALGGWVPEVDANQQTSVPGVWVAGDGGGVAGAAVAQLEGSLVGFAVAAALGSLGPMTFAARHRAVVGQLTRLRRCRAALDRLYRIRPGLTTLAAADTVVCRCEELTRSEVEVGIAAGGTDLRTLKVMTRLGMGPCQGLMCWPAVARLLAARTGQRVEAAGPLSVRPPIAPVSLGTLGGEPAGAAISGPAGRDRAEEKP